MNPYGKFDPERQKQRIQEALRAKLKPSTTTRIHDLHEKRKSIVQTNKRNHSVRNLHAINTLRPADLLTTVNANIVRLDLPERGSFNAAILQLKDRILCVYRPDEYRLVACFLDEKYNIMKNSYYLLPLHAVADPRLLLTPDNKVLLTYSTYTNIHDEHIAGNYLMNLNKSMDMHLEPRMRISPQTLRGRQKNWMPFVHDKKIYFIANVCPHEIYEFEPGREAFQKYKTSWQHTWFNKNDLRGNTNPVMMSNGNFLSTFHTASYQSGLMFYDNGCYIFSGTPPFAPIWSGRKTYLPADAAVEPHVRKKNQIICTFPCGMTIDGNDLKISYGDNDSCVKIMETTVTEMMGTMIKLNTPNSI